MLTEGDATQRWRGNATGIDAGDAEPDADELLSPAILIGAVAVIVVVVCIAMVLCCRTQRRRRDDYPAGFTRQPSRSGSIPGAMRAPSKGRGSKAELNPGFEMVSSTQDGRRGSSRAAQIIGRRQREVPVTLQQDSEDLDLAI